MSEWKIVTLESLSRFVTSGGTPRSKIKEYYENGTIPWMKTKEINLGYVYETEHKITELGLKKSSAKLIPMNSVIIAMYGDGGTAGKVAVNKIPLATNQACCNFVIDDSKADFRYIYFYLKESYDELVSLKSGGAQQNLNGQTLKNFPLRIPSLITQKKIASILSAYDELIENNQKRITILEQMAQNIYNEWFVRFRFPNYENVEIVDGLPKGWEKKPISEYVETQYGYTASAIKNETKPKLLRITDIVPNQINWSTVPHCEIDNPELEKYTLHEGDIVVARTGANTGWAKRIGSNPPKSVFASYLVRLKCKDDTDNIIIGEAVESDLYKKYIQAISTGAAQPQASAILLVMFKTIMPTKEIKLKYNRIISPILKQKQKLLAKNQILKKSRNRLLPRLLSGKLKV
jgi:type I restriction enzyme S subunit